MSGQDGLTSRTYLVHMPKAEARFLAGVGVGWPATPEARCVHAVREWLTGLVRSRAVSVSVRKVADDLGPLLARVPVTERPLSGPFAAPGRRPPLPGRVEYLGAGIVRLDDAALSSLAGLRPGEDFRVTVTDAGAVLEIGADRYEAREEEPDAKA
jgi:hypothetical protein